jgi:hypothetical protein
MAIINAPRAFQYTPLDLAFGNFRLLRILPTSLSQSGQISCQMIHRNFTTHEFWALSYTWGSQENKREILVNGKPFPIGRNLYNFFAAAQKDKELVSCWLWIDQLCINQDSNDERNHQVNQMGSIYQAAAQTVVWLEGSIPAVIDPTIELSEFINREYWSRLWIIQEVLLSRKVQLMNAQGQKMWLENLWSYENYTAAQRPSYHWQNHVLQLLKAKRSGLGTSKKFGSWHEAIMFSRNSGCGDVHDRIYGLLGLVEESIKIVPDVKKPLEQLFLEIILADFPNGVATPHSDPNAFRYGKSTAAQNDDLRHLKSLHVALEGALKLEKTFPWELVLALPTLSLLRTNVDFSDYTESADKFMKEHMKNRFQIFFRDGASSNDLYLRTWIGHTVLRRELGLPSSSMFNYFRWMFSMDSLLVGIRKDFGGGDRSYLAREAGRVISTFGFNVAVTPIMLTYYLMLDRSLRGKLKTGGARKAIQNFGISNKLYSQEFQKHREK